MLGRHTDGSIIVTTSSNPLGWSDYELVFTRCRVASRKVLPLQRRDVLGARRTLRRLEAAENRHDAETHATCAVARGHVSCRIANCESTARRRTRTHRCRTCTRTAARPTCRSLHPAEHDRRCTTPSVPPREVPSPRDGSGARKHAIARSTPRTGHPTLYEAAAGRSRHVCRSHWRRLAASDECRDFTSPARYLWFLVKFW